MKLNRISLPLLERSGWGQAAVDMVRSAIVGKEDYGSGYCYLLQMKAEGTGGCEAQTTKQEYVEKIDKAFPGQAQKKLKELDAKIKNKEELDMPTKADGSQYDKNALRNTYVDPAAEKCGECIFFRKVQ